MFSWLKGKRMYSILNSKCPRCHEGDFYLSDHAYQLKNFGKNHDTCSECGFKYEKEPGFFYGAMYVSYALTVAFSVAIGVAIFVLFPEATVTVYITSILLGLVVLFPLSYRLSRVIWMNFFQSYEGNKKIESQKEAS